MTSPSLQTAKVEQGEGKPRNKTGELLACQVHLAVPGKDGHQEHLVTNVAGRAQDSHQEACLGLNLGSAPISMSLNVSRTQFPSL